MHVESFRLFLLFGKFPLLLSDQRRDGWPIVCVQACIGDGSWVSDVTLHPRSCWCEVNLRWGVNVVPFVPGVDLSVSVLGEGVGDNKICALHTVLIHGCYCSCMVFCGHCVDQGFLSMVFFSLPLCHWNPPWHTDHLVPWCCWWCPRVFLRRNPYPHPSRSHCMVHTLGRSGWSCCPL